jgi:outer membrane protein
MVSHFQCLPVPHKLFREEWVPFVPDIWRLGSKTVFQRRNFFCGGVMVLFMALAPVLHAADVIPALSLKQSIDLALQQSVLLHAVREGVRGAEAQRQEALTGFLPRLSTAYSYTRLHEDPHVTSPGMSLPLPLPIGTVTVPPSAYQAGTKDNYLWSLEARQPLFAGGGIRANYEASRLAADIARFEEKTAVEDLVLEVKSAYFSVLKARRIRDVAGQSVASLKAHRDTAQGFYTVGMIARNDLLQAEVELANGGQTLIRAENAVAMAQARFNTLLRRPLDNPVEIEDMLAEHPPALSLEACIAKALENRPEIRSASLRVEQMRSLVKLSQSEYYPNVGLVGNYSRYGDTPGVAGSAYRDQENWSLMASANWNFWEWGRTQNRVEASRSRENQMLDRLTHLQEQITLEVKNAFLLLDEAVSQLAVTARTIAQAEENFRINTERYREQVGTATEVIDAQTLLAKARSDHFTALSDLQISAARLDRAMGVGRGGQ